MKKYDRLHAMTYADNLTKIYMIERFRRKYPGVFVNAVLETRPADSSRDYYVPPSLGPDRCKVVRKLAWNRTGCRLVACFPFKNYEEACVPGVDSMQWVMLDNIRSIEACQPACERGMSYDSRYDEGEKDCFVSNAVKKLYVMYPERYNGSVAKHARLRLHPVSERLQIDEAYCRAYGLTFDPEAVDCYLRTTQYVAELLVGSTVFRRHLVASNYVKKPPVLSPPPGPSSLAPSFELAWEKNEKNSSPEKIDLEKTADPSDVLDRDDLDKSHEKSSDVEEIARWLATELSVEFGMHVGLRYLRNELAQRISAGLAGRVLKDQALKSAVLHGTLKTAARAAGSGGVAAATTAGKVSAMGIRSAFTLSSAALTVFGIVSLCLDAFDPYEYGKVLDREAVDRIDRYLDLRYYGTDQFRNVRLTPEDAWTVLSDERDVEAEMRHYKKRYDEYMKALYPTSAEQSPPLGKIDLVPDRGEASRHRRPYSIKWFSHWIVMMASFALTCLYFVDHFDYLAVLLGGLFLYWFWRT